jgi:hypothetical protein
MANLSELTVLQLKNLAKTAGLSVSGNKQELIERIAGDNGGSHEIEIQPTVAGIQALDDLGEQMLAAVSIGAQAAIRYTNRFGRMSSRYIVPLYTYEIFSSEAGEVFPHVNAYHSKRKEAVNFALDRMDEVHLRRTMFVKRDAASSSDTLTW